MAKLYCNAIVEHEKQRDNLIECIGIIGVVPEFVGSKVFVEYDGDDKQIVEKLVNLFQQYSYHGISILS